MSVRKIDLTRTHTPVWTYRVRLGENKPSATLEYVDDFDGHASRMPELGSAHPDLDGLVLVEIDSSREEGSQIRVRLNYETYSIGASYPGRPSSEDPVKRYDFEIPTGEEPLLASPFFADLTAVERAAVQNIINGTENKEGGGTYAEDLTSELGAAVLEKIRAGTTHYLEPGFVWVERFNTPTLSDVEITKVGEIMDPPGPRPNPGEFRDYLYLGATGRNSEDGNTWEVERRWQLSGKGKWDADLYAAD